MAKKKKKRVKSASAYWPADLLKLMKFLKKKWFIAPYYGKGAGYPSGATMPPGQIIGTTQPGNPAGMSPAYPGAGGINAPGVPAGANSGMGPVGASYEGEAPSLSEAKKKIGKFKSEKDLCTVCGKKGKIVQGGSWAGAICKKCADEGYHMDPMGTIHAPGSKPWKAYESRLNMLGSAFGRARKFMLESKSILVVDNDKDMAEIAADVIGGNTTVVTDPAKAIKMIKDKKFDIIVTDWNMGRLSGDDVFDAAKDTGAKLVLMSSEPERSRNRNSFDLVITKGERDMLAKFKKVSSL